jgi:peptidoglycan hydrolase-like protein with peptidoglycan-binding domain
VKSVTLQNSISQTASVLFRVFLATALTAGSISVSQTHVAIAANFSQAVPPILVSTAYTDITLPTLRRGDRGRSVQLLQQILSDNGFLGAAGVRLGNPRGATVDGVFGSITESAVRDLQQRYNVPVTGQMNPRTWEVLDMHENPYRSPLPWK